MSEHRDVGFFLREKACRELRFHITPTRFCFSCYRRQPHLSSPKARNVFEASLEAIRRRYGFVAAGYVVMPEHVQLLLGEPNKVALAKALQALKLSVVMRRRASSSSLFSTSHLSSKP